MMMTLGSLFWMKIFGQIDDDDWGLLVSETVVHFNDILDRIWIVVSDIYASYFASKVKLLLCLSHLKLSWDNWMIIRAFHSSIGWVLIFQSIFESFKCACGGIRLHRFFFKSPNHRFFPFSFDQFEGNHKVNENVLIFN